MLDVERSDREEQCLYNSLKLPLVNSINYNIYRRVCDVHLGTYLSKAENKETDLGSYFSE